MATKRPLGFIFGEKCQLLKLSFGHILGTPPRNLNALSVCIAVMITYRLGIVAYGYEAPAGIYVRRKMSTAQTLFWPYLGNAAS